jgi:hypothetical protein
MQSKAALGVTERQPFPPCRNPWQYHPVPGEPDLQFRMFNTLLATVLIGAYLGWLLVRPVPLFPNWLGALASAGVTGYATTLEDSVGDLMRYVGYAVVHTASVVTDTAEEVQVRTYTSAHYTVIMMYA